MNIFAVKMIFFIFSCDRRHQVKSVKGPWWKSQTPKVRQKFSRRLKIVLVYRQKDQESRKMSSQSARAKLCFWRELT